MLNKYLLRFHVVNINDAKVDMNLQSIDKLNAFTLDPLPLYIGY